MIGSIGGELKFLNFNRQNKIAQNFKGVIWNLI